MLWLSSAKRYLLSAHHIRTLGGECCGAGRGVRLAGLVVLRLGGVGAGDGGDLCGVLSSEGGIIVISVDVTVVIIILTPPTRHPNRRNKHK